MNCNSGWFSRSQRPNSTHSVAVVPKIGNTVMAKPSASVSAIFGGVNPCRSCARSRATARSRNRFNQPRGTRRGLPRGLRLERGELHLPAVGERLDLVYFAVVALGHRGRELFLVAARGDLAVGFLLQAGAEIRDRAVIGLERLLCGQHLIFRRRIAVWNHDVVVRRGAGGKHRRTRQYSQDRDGQYYPHFLFLQLIGLYGCASRVGSPDRSRRRKIQSRDRSSQVSRLAR